MTRRGSGDRRAGRGPLQAVELATAAVLAAMTVVVVIVGWFLPHASALTALGVVPMGIVARRHRPRAVLAAVVAASSVGFLVAGTGPISTIVLCGVVGGIAGDARRRAWGLGRVLVAAAVAGVVLAAISDGLLVVFSALRKLTLAQLRDTWRGATGTVARIPALRTTSNELNRIVDDALRDWWETIAVLIIGFTVVATAATWRYLHLMLRRLERVRAVDRLAETVSGAAAGALAGTAAGPSSDRAAAGRRGHGRPPAVRPGSGPPAPARPEPGAGLPVEPVPAVLDDVHVRYPGAAADALAGIGLRVDPGELAVVLGPNGSGKSTLARVLAGRPPTSGTVTRPGVAGLGTPGGTAIVSQRPESQVLGARVADDVVWGVPASHPVDVEAILAAVGLDGMGTRDTATLSGGELQRLAMAAALARAPRLLISDESTAMVDAGGRRHLVGLLRRLPEERDMAVVHVTHRAVEADAADHLIRLVDGRLVGDDRRPASLSPWPSPTLSSSPSRQVAPGRVEGPGSTTARRSGGRSPILVVGGVSHTYAARTPWAQVALRDVDLAVDEGEGLLIVGGNGSGKSTLAWVLAGLLRPSHGACLLDGRPITDQVGAVALAFQHARLQLQRPTVGADVRSAGGVDRAGAARALELVGLDPSRLWDRSVDELSGGQLRRVALAGLLARSPRVLVLDEPLAGLDDEGCAGLLGVLAELRRQRDLTLIVISHDLEGAGGACDRIVGLEGGAVAADEPLVAVRS